MSHRGMAMDSTSTSRPYGIRALDEQLEKFREEGIAC